MVVDDRRAAGLPERWPRRGGERKRRRARAKWNEAVDGLAIPAWDMEATFSRGSGVSDTYSREEIPMYFGSDGVLYVGAGEETPGGTHAGGSTYHTPDSVPEVWHEKWGAWGTIDNRHEITAGFANLVVKYGLDIEIVGNGPNPHQARPRPRTRMQVSGSSPNREVGVPLALYAAYAARALPTVKRGYALIRKWNALPSHDRVAVQAQGKRAVMAIMAVKVAATAERSVADPPATWADALEKIRHPGHAETMAGAIVVYLQEVPEATIEEIATAVGAAGKSDSTLKTAMSMAQNDGYIRRSGVTFRGIKWDTTEWADSDLIDTAHIRGLEAEIVAFIRDFGIASLDHISSKLGLEDDAPELRAALERAISAESIRWYCDGIYGLPLEQLERFEPKSDLWAQTMPKQQDLGGALKELEAAVRGLAAAMKLGAGGDANLSGTSYSVDHSADGHDDPYKDLRRLQELRDDDLLSDEEFVAKKTEILKRI